MNVASPELSRELHDLTGWEPDQWQSVPEVIPAFKMPREGIYPGNVELSPRVPVYDLGYLLRHLPQFVYLDDERNGQLSLWHDDQAGSDWLVRYESCHLSARGDTPEDAAAQLAIELFKQGVLQREEAS